jgi:large subunit ribosomal protein L15
MGTTLHTLSPAKGASKNKKRLGRGIGSRLGKTSGKGVKGQKARTGHHGAIIGFEGGQMPMQRRLPKRGFKNPFRVEYYPVNVGDLDRLGLDAIDRETLVKAGLMPRKAKLFKVLGEGELKRKVTVRAHAFSASAKEKIAKAGGAAEVVEVAKPKQSAEAPAQA